LIIDRCGTQQRMPVLATVVKEYLAQILTGKINAVFCVFA
jgi:hypothetical protein